MACESCGAISGMFRRCVKCANAARAAALSDKDKSVALTTRYGNWALATVLLYLFGVTYPIGVVVSIVASRRAGVYQALTGRWAPWQWLVRLFCLYLFILPLLIACGWACVMPVANFINESFGDASDAVRIVIACLLVGTLPTFGYIGFLKLIRHGGVRW